MLSKISKIITLVIISIIFNVSNIDANNSIRFKNIGIEDGMSQSSVETIFQDSKGYIWIGTHDGLNRYNGHEFKIYKYKENESQSLSGNVITDIDEDSDGYIWVATTNGLNKIDTKTDTIKKYSGVENGGSISNSYITKILFTKEGKFLVSTADGLNIYNEELDIFERVLQNEDLSSQFIYSIEEENNNLWLSTDDGLDKVSKDFKLIKSFKNEEEDSVSSSSIYDLEYDDKGYIWAGTKESGVIRIDLKTNDIKIYQNDENDKNSIGDGLIGDIFKDNLGNLWIGTYSGLSKYDYDKDNFITYTSNEYDKYSLTHNRIKSIYQDDEGLLWIGTYLGISIFDPVNKIQYYKSDKENPNSLSFNSIHGIYEDDEGLLWIGTDSKGINVMDRKNNIITHIDEQNDKYKLSNYCIKDITGKEEYIYIATKDGLNIIDKNLETVKIFKEQDGLKSNTITKLFLDSKNYLWIGTNEGLNILNTKDNTIIDISDIITETSDIGNYVYSIYEDNEGNYYIGLFRNKGLIKINPKDKSVEQYINDKNNDKSLSNNNVRSITQDLNGDIWIATSYGLNKFDKENKEFTRYTMEDGLCNDTVYGILVDNYNNLWLSTNGGISKFDTKNQKFKNFSIVDGLQSNEFNGNAYYKMKSGELVFGGVDGLNILNPKEIELENYTPDIVFEYVEVNGEKISKLNELKLKSSQNSIKIKYFVPKYASNKNTEYHYVLDNGESSETIITKNNDIVFHELADGEYTLKIYPRYSNGETGKEKIIKFEILAPFWKSEVAILLYILLITIFIYRTINKTKRLDKLVKIRTEELVQEMNKNNELLKQVLKLEKNKNNYFVNLSHELRTPLNVISSTNQLISALNSSSKGIDNEKLGYYMQISSKNCERLLNLINNIIDSSKIESNNYILNLKEENIVNVVEEASLSLLEYAKTKKIDMIIDPEIEELYIKCDAYEIERCIVNLVSNAIKFTHEDGSIDICVKQEDKNVIITVQDSGIGIDKKDQKFIFNRFSQVIDANNEMKGGSGLGLTITMQIIKLHKGNIYVESEINKGSKFIIVLPLDI